MARDRNLASINRKLSKGSRILEDSIRGLLAARDHVSVLEVGCGIGVALMELAWEFRREAVSFHGINRTRGEALESSEDLLRTARRLAIGHEPELSSMRLPGLSFEDATRTHFADETFDLVYLSSVLRFVPDKAAFLEEMARILRPGGVALIRIGGGGWDYPYGRVSDDEKLTPHPSRWILRLADELVPLDAYLLGAADGTFGFEFLNRPSCVLRMSKHRSGRLRLGMKLDSNASGPMERLGYGDDALGVAKGGMRSVYEVPRSRVRRARNAPQLADSARRVVEAILPRSEASPRSRTRTMERLARYRVGQQIQVKGRRSGETFRAARIKMVHNDEARDHLVGAVEWIDATKSSLGVLGVTVDWREATRTVLPEMPLEPGSIVKTKGRFHAGVFSAEELRTMARPAILVETIRARIEALDTESGRVTLAGVAVEASEATKIDKLDAR